MKRLAALVAVVLVLTPGAALSAGPAGLPPRPGDPASAPPEWGQLKLCVTMAGAQVQDWQALWTVVQWQDAAGGWNDVDGWRSTHDTFSSSGGCKSWAVDPAMLGKGPFRWVAQQGLGGRLLAASEPFSLPPSTDTIRMVNIALGMAPAPAAGGAMASPQAMAPPVALGDHQIELAAPAAAGWQSLWTIVQWLDGAGGWHDVEGWAGNFDGTRGAMAVKSWVVSPGDSGKGPFRWLVLAAPGGAKLGTSASFYLP
jgi:hypothetical protein